MVVKRAHDMYQIKTGAEFCKLRKKPKVPTSTLETTGEVKGVLISRFLIYHVDCIVWSLRFTIPQILQTAQQLIIDAYVILSKLVEKKHDNKDMPRKKPTVKSAPKTLQPSIIEADQFVTPTGSRRPAYMKLAILFLVALIIGVLVYRQRLATTAATVNGAVISKTELTSKLLERFGEQTLEALIGERLIEEEAVKKNIIATSDEVNAKIKEIEASLMGSMSLDESLKLQGIARSEFESQIRMQLLVEKLLADQATVSASEVAEYVVQNKAILTATTPAEQTTEAEKELRNSKMSSLFADWFAALKEKAIIVRTLK